MNFANIATELKNARLAGRMYEREGNHSFCDRVTVCANGRFKFERYCYGEAASLVCTLWAEGLDEQGGIAWNYAGSPYSGKTEAPVRLCAMEEDMLRFDDKRALWAPKKELKRVPGSSGPLWKKIFGK